MKARFASVQSVLLCILLVCAGGGCTSRLDEDANRDKGTSLALSLKNILPRQEWSTKMTAAVTQSGGSFRGIQNLYIIPFNTESVPVAHEDARLGNQNVLLGSTGISKNGLVNNNNAHLFGSAFVPNNMNRVLVYGKAPDEGPDASKESKHAYGVLMPEGLENPSSSDDIFFRLEPLLQDGSAGELGVVYSTAETLLEQLNVVMSMMGSSANASIKSIYDADKRENKILACSYASFDQIRNEIGTALWNIPYESVEQAEEINAVSLALSAFSTVLTSAGTTFPAQYGIPEGSIGFWWDGKGFVRLINGVNISLVDPESYCYPPSLWYYANSPVKTSNNENVNKQYVASNEQWSDILAHYTDGRVVNTFTQSVAIEDQLEYGVSLLELSLDEPGAAAASLVSGCPLTGIIVGDQKDLDFAFLPSTGPGRYIYDNTVEGIRIGRTGNSVQMLTLPTNDGAPVHFALEFRNNTGLTRYCEQGDILPWCKFYLAGVLDPNAESGITQPGGEVLHSVFSRDHKTTVSVRIESLRNAYTTVPDLHDPQLEIGIVAEMKWAQLTPQSIKLDF